MGMGGGEERETGMGLGRAGTVVPRLQDTQSPGPSNVLLLHPGGHCSRRPAVATGHWAFLNPHVKAELTGYKDPYVAQPSSG